MPETLDSVILKLSDEDAAKVLSWCEERGMRVTKRRREDKTLPNYFLVWGTKRQLTEFKEYF